ncbi:hypothetical protein WJX73_001621 [Symbiochloris irregularis]|uniref:Choline transporter-like protein n=1 Tax=Symbiochloris irregularis TaxID=706552 RepID=A0AAW1NI10_9CHLO
MGKSRNPPPESEPLVLSGFFEFTNRPSRDRAWGLLYLAALALAFAGGIYSAVHWNHDFAASWNNDHMSDPASCPKHRSLLETVSHQDKGNGNVGDFVRAAIFIVSVTLLAPLVGGLGFTYAFKRHAHFMVNLTVQIQVALPAVFGIAMLLMGHLQFGIIFLVLAGISAFTFYLWRNELGLCARLLGVAANGLSDNPGLVGFCLVAVIAMACLWIPLVSLLGASYTNGHIAPKPGAIVQGPSCIDEHGRDTPCCYWELDWWVPVYAALNLATTSWTIFLIGEIRRFVLSATIAQWYFAPPGASMVGTTRRSIGLALGPSFGTCAFGSAILTLIQALRNAMEQAKQDNREEGLASLAWCLVSCVAECFFQLFEFITKFATVRAAITGEAFLTAGRGAFDLFRRNFLKAYAVWWLPPLVLQTGAFLISAVWGGAVFGLAWLLSHGRYPHHAMAGSTMLGILAFLLAWIVQSFFANVLLNVVDAVFMCYAMDRDTQAVTNMEVHEVFSHVPVGVAVENPDGNLGYGAPSAPTRPTQYVPPADPSYVRPSGQRIQNPGPAVV